MVIGAAVAALGSVLFIAWNRYMPGRRRSRRAGYQLDYKPLDTQVSRSLPGFGAMCVPIGEPPTPEPGTLCIVVT